MWMSDIMTKTYTEHGMSNNEEDDDTPQLPPSILNALGLGAIESKPLPPVVVPNTIDDRREFSRKTIMETVAKLNVALDEVQEIGRNSQNDRPYEKVAMLGKTILDGIKEFNDLDIQEHKMNSAPTQTNIEHQTNQIIVATSEQMFDAIKDAARKGKIIDNDK